MRPERFPVISVLDPAIDTESMTLLQMFEYAEKRDVKLIQSRVKPGAKFTVYNVRAVPHSLWQSYVDADPNESVRARRAFQCGVESVDNLAGNDGIAITKWTPTQKAADGSVILSEQELNERFAPSEVLEIGSVIYKHSFFPRRTEASYPLLPGYAEPLAHLKFRSVEPNPSTATTTITEQPSVETSPATETATG